jgi:hypothetical protein
MRRESRIIVVSQHASPAPDTTAIFMTAISEYRASEFLLMLAPGNADISESIDAPANMTSSHDIGEGVPTGDPSQPAAAIGLPGAAQAKSEPTIAVAGQYGFEQSTTSYRNLVDRLLHNPT